MEVVKFNMINLFANVILDIVGLIVLPIHLLYQLFYLHLGLTLLLNTPHKINMETPILCLTSRSLAPSGSKSPATIWNGS